MVYPDLTNYTAYNLSQGFQVVLCYVNDITITIFMNALLIALWTLITLSSYLMSKKQTGLGDFPVSFMLGSFATLIFAIFLRLIDCPYNSLISNTAIAVLIIMNLIGFIFLLFSRD